MIRNDGYIENVKNTSNTRILSLNPRGLSPSNDSKIEMLLEACCKYQIDVILLNETNTKWTTINLDKIEKRFKELGCKTLIIGVDSTL